MGRALAGLLLVALLLGVVSSASGGHALRCSGGLVTKGERQLDVLVKCGEPDVRSDPETSGVGNVIERWTYNFGPHRFYYVITFIRGEVVDIEAPGYGH